MAKTFEALKRAEEEGRKKLNEGIVRRPLTVDRGLKLDVTEEYYRLKQNILGNNSGEKIKALLFSSSTEGEGNSTVLINFAMTLTSGGERVLLVDANLRNPSFHNIFNLERENGLAELVFEKKTLGEVVKQTRFNNLLVITSGTIPRELSTMDRGLYSNNRGPGTVDRGLSSHDRGPSTMDYGLFNPCVLFESKSLDSHIAKMKAEAEWVLFDSPPINLFNDSIALASRVDGVVMVVEAEKTRWEVAQSAKQRIEENTRYCSQQAAVLHSEVYL
jgi:Mrp family chromosome partitioning ATPase